MKTTLTSNWRPLLRAFYALVIAIAALSAMPKNAHAGAAISPSFITGLNAPSGLAVFGNTLFVANQFGTTVGKYDATTGEVIKADFIRGLSTPRDSRSRAQNSASEITERNFPNLASR